jgi:hypothetical protein
VTPADPEAPLRRWESPDSLRGLLQRGRGAGWLQATAGARGPDVTDAVVNCVIDDPRLDPQIEDRGWYYAGVITELDCDLGALQAAFERPLLGGDDEGAWLAMEVLELSAMRGRLDAVDELFRYLRSGRDIGLALDHLFSLAERLESQSIVDQVLDERPLSELVGLVPYHVLVAAADKPWAGWRAASPKLEEFVRLVLARRDQEPDPGSSRPISRLVPMLNRARPPVLASALDETTAELLNLADTEPDWWRQVASLLADRRGADDHAALVAAVRSERPGAKRAALLALGTQGDDVVLDIGLPIIERDDDGTGRPPFDPLVTAAWQGLLRLRSPRARNWARATTATSGMRGRLGCHLLGVLGTESDTAHMRSLLASSVNETIWLYPLQDLVRGLRRLGDNASVPVIAEVFAVTAYSYLRWDCVKALADLSPSFGSETAFECLWDCESGIRLIATERVDLRLRGVRSRLRQMASDPTEEDDCRQQAASRVT